ncbi:MAG TPA: hypothetical protein VGL71_13090, partial [Urbifossiella sp.]
MRSYFSIGLVGLVVFLVGAVDESSTLKIDTCKTLPGIESISVYLSESIKPGKERPKPFKIVKLAKGATSATAR